MARVWLQEIRQVTMDVASRLPKGVTFPASRWVRPFMHSSSPVPSKSPEKVEEMHTMQKGFTMEITPPPERSPFKAGREGEKPSRAVFTSSPGPMPWSATHRMALTRMLRPMVTFTLHFKIESRMMTAAGRTVTQWRVNPWAKGSSRLWEKVPSRWASPAPR